VNGETARAGSQLFRLLFCALFVLIPAAVAIAAGWWPLWHVTEAAWRRGALVEVPATVLQVELKSQTSSSKTRTRKYWVEVRYAYRWQGRDRIGTQATWPQLRLTSEADSTALFARLDRARATTNAVPAWVDPGAPDYAVLDTRIPWAALLFAVPIALIFSAVAAGFAMVWVAMLRSRRRRP